MTWDSKNRGEPTKTKLVYIIMPGRILIVEAKPKTQVMRYKNAKKLVNFQESMNRKSTTFYYELPSKGVALEEYLDYIVINAGVRAQEEDFKKIIEIATKKEKGLILRPPKNPKHLFMLDRITLVHNELYGFTNIRY
jgi:hypothetical protein